MSLLGNILWLIFGGGLVAFLYALAGALLCLTIVGIPFGLQAFRFAGALLMPFGKEVVSVPEEQGFLRLVFNVIWLIAFGWELAIAHLSAALILAVTIIGIPFAWQHLKLVVVALWPFGYRLEEPKTA